MSGQPANQSSTGRRVVVNVGALGVANLFRIGLSFALQLFVAHFLGVAALGLYAATLAYLHLFQVVSEWGLPALLTRDLARAPQNRRAGYRAALIIQTTLATAIWLGVTVTGFLLPEDVRALLWIAAMSLPFYAVMSASEALCEACERMTLVMAVEVSTNALLFMACVVVLWRGGHIIHLMATIVVVQAVAALVSLAVVKGARLLTPPQHQSTWSARWLMRRALPFFGLALTDVLQQRVDLLLLGFIADPTMIGVYAAANSLVRILVKLAQSYWRALYPTLSRLYQEGRERFSALQEMALRLGWGGALFAAAVGAGLAVEIVALLFGAKFAATASVLRILVWSAPLYMLESYAVTALFVQGRPRQSLLVGLTHLGVVVVAMPVFFLRAGVDGAALSMMLASLVGAGVGVWHLRTMMAPAVRTLGLMAAAAMMTTAAIWLLQERVWLAFAVGAVLYGGLVWLAGGVSRADVAQWRRAFYEN